MSTTSLPTRLSALPRDGLLRLALKLDAVVTAVNGAAYLAAAGPLSDLLGVEASLLRPIGVFLLLFAAGVWFVASRPAVSGALVGAVIAANAAWALGSIAFAVFDASSPSGAGSVWIVLQALVVAGFAGLQAAARPAG